MNKRVIAALSAGVVLAAGVAFGAYRLGQHSVQPAPAVKPAEGRKILYWQDPMVPGKRFDKPGKSPYMDMELVPVYADDQADAGSVRVSPGVQQNLGIRYAQVRQGSIGGGLRLVGNIAFNERERVVVQARSAGYVERLHARAPMDVVRKGQALLDLYVPDWVAAQEDYLSIKRMGTAQAAGLLDAALQRMRLAGMTDAQIRQVAASGYVVQRVAVTAPSAGVISELSAREGMTVAAGTPLVTISGLGTVWANAEVPESAAASVRPGMRVLATTPAYPGESFDGKVEALLPQVNPATRTLTARIELRNPQAKLSPGMFADIELKPEQHSEALLVPSEAVIQTGTRAVVILAEDTGAFRPVEISTGAEANGETQVLAGLRAGQRVVASGQFLIDSEASLRSTLRRIESAPQAAAAPAAPATHPGHGRIEKIAPGEITISHEPIPGLNWGPMTMGFVPPTAGLPAGLKAGDSIDFEIRRLPDGRYQIVALRPAQNRAPGHVPHAAHGAGQSPSAGETMPAPGQAPQAGDGGHDSHGSRGEPQ